MAIIFEVHEDCPLSEDLIDLIVWAFGLGVWCWIFAEAEFDMYADLGECGYRELFGGE